MADEIRSYGPGPFATLIDEAVSTMADDGADEELAEEGYGTRRLLRGRLDEAISHSRVPLNQAEREFLTRQVGAVIHEASDGSVTINYYEESDALDAAWAQAQEDFDTFLGADTMDDQDSPVVADDVPLP